MEQWEPAESRKPTDLRLLFHFSENGAGVYTYRYEILVLDQGGDVLRIVSGADLASHAPEETMKALDTLMTETRAKAVKEILG